MVKKIFKILKKLYLYYLCKINPIKFAKIMGVKVGLNTKFYGANPNMFSTEPWLITLGNNVHITADVLFLTHDGGTLILKEDLGYFVLCGSIEIGDNTYIGTRSVIMPGVKIGKRCIIGACSVVTKDIPDNSVAVGVPAKVIKTTDDYLQKLKDVMDNKNSRYYSTLEQVRALKNVK